MCHKTTIPISSYVFNYIFEHVVVQVAHDADVILTTNMDIGTDLRVTSVYQVFFHRRALNVLLVRLSKLPILYLWSTDQPFDKGRLFIRDGRLAASISRVLQINVMCFSLFPQTPGSELF